MSSQNISPIIQRISQAVSQGVNYASMVFGAFYSDWAVQLVNWHTFPYVLAIVIGVMVPTNLILRKRAKHLLPRYRTGVGRFLEGMCNVVIGGLGVGWWALIVGLSPFFFTAPMVIIPIALYGLAIADIFWLRSTFRKASEISILS
jgi:hypothetical protein